MLDQKDAKIIIINTYSKTPHQYSLGAAFLPNPPISSPCTVRLRHRFLVETEMVLIPDAHYPQLPLKLSVESSLPLTA